MVGLVTAGCPCGAHKMRFIPYLPHQLGGFPQRLDHRYSQEVLQLLLWRQTLTRVKQAHRVVSFVVNLWVRLVHELSTEYMCFYVDIKNE